MEKKAKFAVKPLISLLALAVAAPVASVAQQNDEEMEKAIRLTNLQGMDVMTEDGESVGTVDDIVFSPQTGQIEGVVVGTGFLGIGGSQKLIKLDNLEKHRIADADLRTSLSRNDFNKIKDFDPEQLLDQSAQDGQYSDIQSDLMTAMQYKDNQVENIEGANRGEIHDYIVDVNDGRVPYIIMKQLPPAPTDVRYNYFAVSSDNLVGVRDGEVVIKVEDGEFIDAETIDEPALKAVDDTTSVYQFRYDPSAMFGAANN